MIIKSVEEIEGDLRSEQKIRKIFTCAEIEGTLAGNESKSSPTMEVLSLVQSASEASKSEISEEPNLKQVDPAVMHFSSNRSVTRYKREELEVLKESKTSQSPPLCLYDPKIIRLNILKYEQSHSEDYESQMKAFRELLPNLSMSSWDPKVLELLNTYHRSLLYPSYMHNDLNNPRSPRTINQNFNRRVSWGDQKQFLDSQQDKLPAYDQKNFFDNITTTTTMRPPRMGVGSLGGYQKKPQQQQSVRSAKGNSCSSENYSQYPQNLSTGSICTNETKSSYDESIIDKSLTDKADSIDINLKSDKHGAGDHGEKEPEWFSWPASRHDVIDLHGFEEEEGQPSNTENIERPSSRNSPNKMGFDDFVQYNHRQQADANVASSAYRRSTYNQPSRYPRGYNNPNIGNICNSSGSTYYSNNGRYRNPLHQSNSSQSSFNSSFNRSGSDYSGHNIEVAINPFFEAWKCKNGMGNGNQMMTIADVENAMKQQRGAYYQQHQAYGLPYGGNPAVPQFFQNAAASTSQNCMGIHQMPGGRPFTHDNIQQGSLPTPEQLQQHTSEIMRNAIMRKQYHDRKFP